MLAAGKEKEREMAYPRDMKGYGRAIPDPQWPGGAFIADLVASEKAAPCDQLFILVYAKSSKTADSRIRRLRKLFQHDIGSVKFVKSVVASDKIKVFCVPMGAKPPIP